MTFSNVLRNLLSRNLYYLLLILISGITSCAQKEAQKEKDITDPRLAGFKGKIGKSFGESTEDWPERPKAPAGAPNVLIILLDDVGFGQLSCYGGLIETPNLDSLAANGLIYTNFHTTALCSPSRASLMAGRNHHSIGLGSHAATAMGFPGYNGMIPPQAASGAKMLQQHGYTTYAIGKWDHTPLWEVTGSGPFTGWASNEGFDHYYGFMTADMHNFQPIMYNDHWPANPAVNKPDYHINTDMADRAIYWLTSQASVAAEKPFLMFWASPTLHAPHHASKKYLDKYKGRFNMGWDSARSQILQNQIDKGFFAGGTSLAPRPADIPEWSSLTEEKKRMYSRQMEAAAAALTQADEEIGRIIATLKRTGQLNNTLIFVTSDNGSSGEGGLEGSHNEMLVVNGISKTPHEENEKFFDRWGTAETDNHYHAGWAMAGNTPFRYFKQTNHNGGTQDPLIVHWPAGIKAKGQVRKQYHHIIDIIPTVMDLSGVGFQNEVDGVEQMPFDGTSMKYSFDSSDVPSNHQIQYYEQFGNRALYDHGWKAVSLHGQKMPWMFSGVFDFEKDVWELYNINEDPTETTDLANTQPEKLDELKRKWNEEALKYNVFPLYDDVAARAAKVTQRLFPTDKKIFTYFTPGAEFIAEAASPPVKNRNHTITALVETDGNTDGVIVACGGYFSGYSLFVKNNILTYTYNYLDEKYFNVRAERPLTKGKHEIRLVYKKQDGNTASIEIYVDGEQVGSGRLDNIVLGKFSVSEPFDVGTDNGGAVNRKEYGASFKFTDKLEKVLFQLE